VVAVSLSSRYSLTPTVVQTLMEDSRAVLGIAAISGHVYLVRAESPEIEVYSAVTWSLKIRLSVVGLRSPTDVVGCESTGCLFVSDWPECRIHRVDGQMCRRDGLGDDSAGRPRTETSECLKDEEVSSWCTTERPWSLSLIKRQCQCTVLVTCDQVNTSHGRASVKTVSLAASQKLCVLAYNALHTRQPY